MTTVRLPLEIDVDVDVSALAGVDLAAEAFEAAWKDGRIQAAVRDVLRDTLLAEYRQLLLQNINALISPILISGGSTQLRPVSLALQEQQQWVRALQAFDQARTGRDRKTARKKIAELQEALSKKIDKTRPESDLSTGQFAKRVVDVLTELTDPLQIDVWREEDGRISFGIGYLPRLNRIMAPSFKTPRGMPTPVYPKAFLWRIVEYGAGAFSTDPRGKRRPNGWSLRFLQIKGIKGLGGFRRWEQRLSSPEQGVQAELRRAIQGAVLRG